MNDAPERIWTCAHVGEYGYYFPDAVEAEGEYGGTAVQYTRADLHDARIAALVEACTNLVAKVRRNSEKEKRLNINVGIACMDCDAALAAFKQEPKP